MEVQSFEAGLKKHIQVFTEGRPKPSPTAYAPTGKLKVTLRVRKKRITKDEFFTLTVNTISKLHAVIEAKKAAREAGWPIIAFVQDVEEI